MKTEKQKFERNRKNTIVSLSILELLIIAMLMFYIKTLPGISVPDSNNPVVITFIVLTIIAIIAVFIAVFTVIVITYIEKYEKYKENKISSLKKNIENHNIEINRLNYELFMLEKEKI